MFRGRFDESDESEGDTDEDEELVNSDDEQLPDLDTPEFAEAVGEPAKKKGRQERKVWSWTAGDLEYKEMPENKVKSRGMEQCRYPVDYFMKMFGEKTFQMLLEQTNIHRRNLKLQGKIQEKVDLVTMKELRQVVGILMYISVVRMPNTRMFWSKNMGHPAVNQVMPRERFENIIMLMHMSDNREQPAPGAPNYDKLYKVRKLLEYLNINFQQHAEMEKVVSVDEQMIPFKGRLGFKVYMKNKPAKWGIKIWALAGQSGYVHSFNVFGDNLLLTDGAEGIGASGQTVLNLTEILEPGTQVFFDNYFASPGLLLALQEKGLPATCTLRSNRIEQCPLKGENVLKKEGRGSMDHQVSEEGILVARWYDNKAVMVGSNHYSVNPPGRVKRWDRKKRDYVHISIPYLIRAYNKGMGGVDRCDQLLSFYR
jgi:Transposase IS4